MEYIEIKKENTKLSLKDLKKGNLFKFKYLISDIESNVLFIKTNQAHLIYHLLENELVEISKRHLEYDVVLYELVEPIKVKEVR